MLRRFSTILIAIATAAGASGCVHMPPGRSYRGQLAELTAPQIELRDALRADVQALAGDIGPRAMMRLVKHEGTLFLKSDPQKLHEAQHYLERRLGEIGYDFHRQEYEVDGVTVANLIAERPGGARADEVVVVGAHYDTVVSSPGANDNASGVAALLALAKSFSDKQPARTVRFVFFVNEEQPYCLTEQMGSYVYARWCSQSNDKVVAMLSLDEIGYFDEHRGTQQYPFPLGLLYPSSADFICFVANPKNRRFMNQVVTTFRRGAKFPSEGMAMGIEDVGRSDHWSFWQHGYPALMITDSANFRYAHYHRPSDTPDKLDYDRLTHLTTGLEHLLHEMTHSDE